MIRMKEERGKMEAEAKKKQKKQIGAEEKKKHEKPKEPVR